MRVHSKLILSVSVVMIAGALLTALSVGNVESATRGPGLSQPPPLSPDFTSQIVQQIFNQAVAKADRTASANGLRSNTNPALGPVVQRPTKMHIAVVARDGSLQGLFSMQDAWVGSVDIAVAKARTAAFFSSDENALTSRIIGVLSQAHNPDGSGGAASLWGIGNSNQVGITGGPDRRNGLITFPGGVPLYRNGRLIGAVGVSGDGVDQDEAVAFGGAAGFGPGPTVVKLGHTPPTVTAFP